MPDLKKKINWLYTNKKMSRHRIQKVIPKLATEKAITEAGEKSLCRSQGRLPRSSASQKSEFPDLTLQFFWD